MDPDPLVRGTDPHRNVTDPQHWRADVSSTGGHGVAGVVSVRPCVRPARQTPYKTEQHQINHN